MRLILMRHAEAEAAQSDLPDPERRLTPKARRSLNDHLPSFARYLTGTDQLKIWTSPYRRAKETADILARYLPGAKIKKRDFLATGDTDALFAALSPIHGHCTVVLIGHEPHLSNWIEIMAKRRTHLPKGGMELLLLDPESPTQAIRMGALTLPELKQLEPLDMPLNVGLKEILLHHHTTILQLKDQFCEDVEDEQTLHYLRIAICRQKSYLQILKPFADKKAYRKAQKAYNKLFENLTHLRELDVLLETIHHSKRWELEAVVNDIMAERNDEAMRLDMYFSDPENEASYNKAYDKAMIALASVQESTILSEAMTKIMPKSFKNIQEKTALLLDSHDHKALYQLRRQYKYHRYRYERFASVAGYAVAKRYAAIRNLDHMLGQYGDTFYNTEVMRSIIDGTTDSKALLALDIYARLQLEARSKYDKTLRQQMLDLIKMP